MMAAVGRVAIVALALSVGSAQAATDIDLFFPVPVQGKLANEMQRLIEQFDKDHADIHVTAVYTGSYDDTNLKTRAAIQAGTTAGRSHHERQFHPRICDQQRRDRARRSDRQGRPDTGTVHGPVLAGTETECHRAGPASMACRSRIRRRCCTTASMRSRMPASIPTSRRSPGRTGWTICARWPGMTAAARRAGA